MLGLLVYLAPKEILANQVNKVMTVTLVSMDLSVFLENQAFQVEKVTEVPLVMMA